MDSSLDRIASYGVLESEPWRILRRHLDLTKGFSLIVMTVPDGYGEEICRLALEGELRLTGKTLFRIPASTKEEVQKIASSIAALDLPEGAGAVWLGKAVDEAAPDFPAWRDAWKEGLSRLNEYRNPMERRYPVPVILTGAPWLVPLMRDSAPDLWSYRSAVVRISPPVKVEGEGQIPEPPSPDPERDAPDLDLALSALALLPEGHRGAGQEAKLMGRISAALRARGRRDEAEQYGRNAARIYRRLAEQRPDEFLPDFARSLNGWTAILGELGRREEALEAAEEAVHIYRTLAAARPDAFLPDLATSLNNWATTLSGLGRHEEASEAAQEAVRIYRALVEPDG